MSIYDTTQEKQVDIYYKVFCFENFISMSAFDIIINLYLIAMFRIRIRVLRLDPDQQPRETCKRYIRFLVYLSIFRFNNYRFDMRWKRPKTARFIMNHTVSSAHHESLPFSGYLY